MPPGANLNQLSHFIQCNYSWGAVKLPEGEKSARMIESQKDFVSFTRSIALVVAFAFVQTIDAEPLLADALWKTGEAFKRELETPVGVTWTNGEFRPRIEGFAASHHTAVMLDRRIDPNQKIELSFDDVPLGEAWKRIASRIGAETTTIGPVVYIGPANPTKKLRTMLAQRTDAVAQLPQAARQRWRSPKAWTWDDAAAPRDLLASLCRESGVQIDNLTEIPADLWAGNDLPALDLVEKLTLLLAQFDLTYEVDASGLRLHLTPIPDSPIIVRSHPLPAAGSPSLETLRGTGALSATEMNVQGKTLVVRGTQEEHELVDAALAGRTAKTSSVKEGRKVFTLNVPVEKPASKLLTELAAKLDWDLKIDRDAIQAAGLSADALVTVNVKDATEDELLRAILDPAKLRFSRRGNLIEVGPK
jgi:hypothetical protein